MSKGNMLLGHARGKVGDIVFSRRLGQQTTRAYTSRVNDAATRGQVAQRSKISNIIANYRALRRALAKGFETKKEGQTDYNVFTSLNLSQSQVYLTAEEAAAGVGIAAPYIISRGSLQPIQVAETTAGTFITDIAVPVDFDIEDTTTIGQLAYAIISVNADWMEGDQLSIVAVEQFNQGGYPKIAGRFYEITLNTQNNDLVYETVPEDYLDVVGGYIGLINPNFIGAGAHIQSRLTADGRLLVSSAQLMLTSSNKVYAQYSGEEAQTRAVMTRGYNEDVFLSPASTGVSSAPPPVAPIIFMSAMVGTTQISPGGVFEIESGKAITINVTPPDTFAENGIIRFTDDSTVTISSLSPTVGAGSITISAASIAAHVGKKVDRLQAGSQVLATFDAGGFVPDPNA